MISNTRRTFTCKVNFQLLCYGEVILKLIFTSFMDFQSNLACLCLEVSIFLSHETKTKILAFFFFFGPELLSRVLTLHGCPNHTVDLQKSVSKSNNSNNNKNSDTASFLQNCLLNVPDSHNFEISRLLSNFKNVCLLTPISVALCNCICTSSYLKLLKKCRKQLKKKKKNSKEMDY